MVATYTDVNIKSRRQKIVPKVVCFPVNQVIGKKQYNVIVEACLLHNERKEPVVK